MKRFVALVIVLVMVFLLVGCGKDKYRVLRVARPVSPVSDFIYVHSGGGITITGYHGTGGDVIIPAKIDGWPVTCIGHDAFAHSVLTPTDLPLEVKEKFASDAVMLKGYDGVLTSVTIPNGVTSIEAGAFMGNSFLRRISIPNSVTSIGDSAHLMIATASPLYRSQTV